MRAIRGIRGERLGGENHPDRKGDNYQQRFHGEASSTPNPSPRIANTSVMPITKIIGSAAAREEKTGAAFSATPASYFRGR
jgi:hypothetical protein